MAQKDAPCPPRVLPKDIVITRFGVLSGTITVWILNRDVQTFVQATLKKLFAHGKLVGAPLEPDSMVCLNLHGVWQRACIMQVDESQKFAQLKMLDTCSVLNNCPCNLLFKLPSKAAKFVCRPFFIESFAPHEVSFGYKSLKNGAPYHVAAAAFLNAELNGPMSGRLMHIQDKNFSRDLVNLEIVTINMDALDMNLSEYVRQVFIMNQILLKRKLPMSESPFESGEFGIEPFCPTEEEACEILSIEQNEDGSHKIGLGVGERGDVIFLKRRQLALEPWKSVNGSLEKNQLVSIYSHGLYERAIVIDGDLLLCFDSGKYLKRNRDMRICRINTSTISCLPNMSIFVDSTSLSYGNGERITVGDKLIVRNLRKKDGIVFSYDSFTKIPPESFDSGVVVENFGNNDVTGYGEVDCEVHNEGSEDSGDCGTPSVPTTNQITVVEDCEDPASLPLDKEAAKAVPRSEVSRKNPDIPGKTLCEEFGEKAALQYLKILRFEGTVAICVLEELSRMLETVLDGLDCLRSIDEKELLHNSTLIYLENEKKYRVSILANEICDGLVPVRLMDHRLYKCVPISSLFAVHEANKVVLDVPEHHIRVRLSERTEDTLPVSFWIALWNFDGFEFEGKILHEHP